MKKFPFLLLFSAGVLPGLFAQSGAQQKVDSLVAELDKPLQDTVKVKTLITLSREYININSEQGIYYGKQALNLANRLKSNDDIAAANSVLGSNYVTKGEYADGIAYEYAALQIYQDQHDTAKQAVLLRNLAIAHNRSKNHDEALRYNNMSLQMYFAVHDSAGVAAVYSNMANVHRRLKNSDSVLVYHLKALHLFEAMHDPFGIARVTGNIANYYADEGDFAVAMVYYSDALRQERALNNTEGIARNLGNVGETFFEMAQEPTSFAADSLVPNGKKALLDAAISYLEEAVALTRKHLLVDYFLEYSEVLSEVYTYAGRTDEAFSLYKEFVRVKDSVYDIDDFNRINSTRLAFEHQAKEDSLLLEQTVRDVQLTNEKESRKRDLTFYIIGSVLGLIFTGFIINRLQVTRKQKKIIETERNRSEELLLNILPEETAAELKEKGSADAQLLEQVTVLFTDFKGFTQLAESLGPKELVSEINECFSAFDRIMEKHGVEKIKTIGDAYMAAGGLPTPNSTHAADVVRAAIDIRNFMSDWSAAKKAKGIPAFEIRIGVHTGPVVAGIVGVKKFQYDIWGDTVNTASRMESSGETGKVNISATTYELVKDEFKCTARGKIQAKNKGELEMYFAEQTD